MSSTETRTATDIVIYPTLKYDDASAAIDWLCDAFGFERQAVFPGQNGAVAHAELRLGAGVVMIGSTRDNDVLRMRSPRALGGVTASVYVCLPEVDAHYERARAAGAEMVIPLRVMDYGSREYTCRDPEGNLWSFGTYRA